MKDDLRLFSGVRFVHRWGQVIVECGYPSDYWHQKMTLSRADLRDIAAWFNSVVAAEGLDK